MNRLSILIILALLCGNQVSARELTGLNVRQDLICSSHPISSAAKAKVFRRRHFIQLNALLIAMTQRSHGLTV